MSTDPGHYTDSNASVSQDRVPARALPAAHRPVRLPRGRPRPLRRLHRLALPVALPGRHLPAAGRPVLVRGRLPGPLRRSTGHMTRPPARPAPTSRARPRSPACRRTPATTRTRTPRSRRTPASSGTTSRSPASPPASRPTPATTSTPPPRPPRRPARPAPTSRWPASPRASTPPRGTTSAEAGSTSQAPCQAGTYQPAAGAYHAWPQIRGITCRAKDPLSSSIVSQAHINRAQASRCLGRPTRIIHYPECICVCYALLGGAYQPSVAKPPVCYRMPAITSIKSALIARRHAPQAPTTRLKVRFPPLPVSRQPPATMHPNQPR